LTFHHWVVNKKVFQKHMTWGNLELKMEDPADICTREVIIVNELGMHARAAAMIAKLATQAQGTIWLEKSKERADASSIIDMLSLGCTQGSRIKVCADDPKDRPVLERIVRLIEEGFGE
jgi:phosphotransferase system HPr (HPr) family protein